MSLEQRGVIPAHHTRINGKIPDFTIAREGGVTEYVEFTMATVLACTHDAKPIPVARNRELRPLPRVLQGLHFERLGGGEPTGALWRRGPVWTPKLQKQPKHP